MRAVNKILYSFFLLLIMLIPKSVKAQLETNGSFENSKLGLVTGNDVKGWLISVDTGLDTKFEIINTQAKDGSQCMKVSLNQMGANAWSIQLVGDSIKVNPGETYSFSIWVKAEKAGAQANFTVGNYSYKEYTANRQVALTTDWKEYTLSFTINDQEKIIRCPIHLSIAANAGNNIYFDNMKVSKPGGTNVYNGPALATGKSKFLGNIYSSTQSSNFISYWNQVIPENAGKWASVEGTKDVMNWTELDAAYNLAINNKLPFNFHVLVWGQQQPSWMTDGSLNATQQLAQITEWFKAVAARYPKIDILQVVNEPLPGHNPAQYKAALGGDGSTGWDWVVNAFQLARDNFPKTTKLMMNEFGILGSISGTNSYLKIIKILKSKKLIDCIGVQGHAFTTKSASASDIRTTIDSLWATGLPVYVTEMDVDGTDDNVQLAEYKRIFPTIWEHKGIYGITFWGWRRGLWRDSNGAYLINTDGSERPSMTWLKSYVQSTVVDVKNESGIPSDFNLFDNYPNPFNPSTNISYNIAKETNVKLEVFDILGRHVQTLVDKQQSPGKYNIEFNAGILTSGVYIYRLQAGTYSSIKKLVLMK